MSQFLPGEGGDWPHAVLVEQDGADGVRFAREAAAILLCGRRDCACGVCRRVREGIHPDVQLLDRGERDIAVDDVRALRRDECTRFCAAIWIMRFAIWMLLYWGRRRRLYIK